MRAWMLDCAAVTALIAALLIVRTATGEPTTLERASAWMDDHACASVTREARPAENGALEAVLLDREHLGGSVIYERFASAAALRRAAHGERRCVVGREALTIALFVNRPTQPPLCRHLGGRLST
jgi:hypothetical protein